MTSDKLKLQSTNTDIVAYWMLQ